ncbi:helix-turn-helix domain-containing protein [Zongyangia hominis]|uniref:Helix-turn-helix transcriptional regulator n=1 Tax=Zongyangia hominis TaxID=2763677 RepID=A0A926EEZ8_9FIRM|nr:helix-turn-helix transcriptional regulator [Zongyangia hominis]MBC8570492.1 helix-turn-helix transcriptional regulator [Zongyangia hominis]
MELSQRLQALRKERGYSQEDLAEQLGISRQAVSKWESGASSPDIGNLLALSGLYGVSVDALLRGEEAPPPEAPSPAPDLPAGLADTGSRKIVLHIPLRHYEYKSKRTLRGLPLVHIHFGLGCRAKGVIAVGNVATGILSLGLVSLGVVSFGCVSVGLLSLGALAIGLLMALGGVAVGGFALGGVAVGIVALGGLAVGQYAIGWAAVASQIAIGDMASSGHLAIGNTVDGVRTLTNSLPAKFTELPRDQVRDLILREFPRIWRPLLHVLTSIFH